MAAAAGSEAGSSPSTTSLQILQRLSQKGPSNPYHLIPWQDGTLPEFWEAYQQLLSSGLLIEAQEAGKQKVVSVSEAGQAAVQRYSDPCFAQLQCSACEGRGYTLPPEGSTPSWQLAADFHQTYAKILEKRPPPAEEYDQTAITDRDMIVRAGFMHERGDVAGKSILLVGDADLLSICLALTKLPKRVHVIDIDVRVINFVNETAREQGWDFVTASTFDVRLPFPQELRRSFDVFCSDPVETVEGLRLFLSHGAMALRGEGSVCYFGLTTLEAGRKKWYQIQKMLLEQNYVMTDVRRNFNTYYNTDFNDEWPIGQRLGPNDDDYRWYWTAFLRCEAIDTPKPLVNVDEIRELSVEIYRDDEAWATPPPKETKE